MNTLSAHLAKDWHEQRRGIVALLGLALLAPLASLLIPSGILPASTPIAELALVCMAAVSAVVLASDLVPRELATGASGAELFARLPGGLARALHGKALVFVVGVACTTLVAALAGAAVDVVRGGLDARTWGFDTSFALLVAAAFLPWLFAASTFVTRGAWVAPVALLTTWPVVALAVIGFMEAPNDVLRAFALVANTAVAYGVACFAFVGGHARGRSPGRAAKRGAIVMACLCLPLVGHTGNAVLMSLSADPARDDFRIANFVLDPQGNKVWVNSYSSGEIGYSHGNSPDFESERYRALVVDVASGAWNFVGARGSYLGGDPRADGPKGTARPSLQHIVVVDEGERLSQGVVWDASSARRLPDAEADAVAAAMSTPLAENWSLNGRGVIERYGDARLDVRYRDPLTGHVAERREFADAEGNFFVHVMVRDGAWVLRHAGSTYELWDPTTRERRPAASLLANHRGWYPVLLVDGRFVVLTEQGRLVVVDPEEREAPIEIAGLFDALGLVTGHPIDAALTVRDAAGPLLARLVPDGGEPTYVALAFDPPRFVGSVPAQGRSEYQGGWLDDTRALVLEDECRLVELDFERGTRRVVFPR